MKQHKFNMVLKNIKDILNEHKQPFFLTCGTLLGLVRENKFIDYDNDIDLGIFYKDLNYDLKDIILNSNKFKLKEELGNIKNSYKISFIHKILNVVVDIFIHYPIKNKYYYCVSYYTKNKIQNTFKWKYPITKLKYTFFYDNKYLVPDNSTEYLEFAYGKDWKIPKKFNYIQGLEYGYKNLIC